MKRALKKTLALLASVLVSPLSLTELVVRRIRGRDTFFVSHGELLSLLPGRTGCFLRNAYYRATLKKCSVDAQLSFGTFLSNCSLVEIGNNVYVGAHCLIGIATIGDGVLIADHVQILSGANQHSAMDETKRGDDEFRRVHIGEKSWIGAGAIIMADVGEHAIVGAGSVVTKPVPPYSVVAGVPARVLRTTDAQPTVEAASHLNSSS